MNHPFESAHNGNARHQQLIKNAENARRAKSLRQSQPRLDLFAKLRQIFALPESRPVEQSADPAVR